MSVNGMKFGLSPDRLQIEEVRLLEPGAKVVIFKDRSVNLAKVLRDQNAAITDTKPQTAQTPSPAVVSQENRALFPMNIDRVRVEKGVVDFADLSLVLPFATRVTDFNGSVTGISSESTSRASVNRRMSSQARPIECGRQQLAACSCSVLMVAMPVLVSPTMTVPWTDQSKCSSQRSW